MKEPVTTDFFLKIAAVKSVNYCQLFGKFHLIYWMTLVFSIKGLICIDSSKENLHFNNLKNVKIKK